MGKAATTVLHVLPYMAKGGTEKHVLTLMRGLRARYRCMLLAPRGEILPEFLKLEVEYFEFPELRGNVLRKVAEFKERLKEIESKRGIDIVHVHAAHEFVSFTRRVLPETPIIFHLSAHQGSWVSRNINYKLSASIARRKADILIAVSEEEKRIVTAKGFPPERVAVVYNGYETSEGDDTRQIDEIREKHGLKGMFVVGNLGRLHRSKRLDLLVEAFAALKREGTKGLNRVRLLLIGDGPDGERIRSVARRLGVSDTLTFTGFIPRGDRVLKIFDVFVLPTTYEGCSNVLVEAMAKGLPIVTTNIPSVRWMFEDGASAALFEKNSIRGLAGRLEELIGNDGDRRTLGIGARCAFEEKFSARGMVEKTDRLYRELMKSR
jgi:glycosyltransferase involved in cell wall biosynthesis